MSEIIHLSFYRFYPLGERQTQQDLRVKVRALCLALELKGTILIAAEGVNAMVTGSRSAIDSFKLECRKIFGVDDYHFKEGEAPRHAFRRMLVRLKKEIIPVGDPAIKPHEKTAKRISPAELKKWFEDQRPMILLDTRNQYEVDVGTFKGALSWRLDSSRAFLETAKKHRDELKGAPIVTFCTGGIRCEKASAALVDLGLEDEVYQLDGGILRYFEENGGAYFDGSCFVFDWRLAVDGNLKPVQRSDDPDQVFGRHLR